jgi:hypothetical protein
VIEESVGLSSLQRLDVNLEVGLTNDAAGNPSRPGFW